MLTIIWIVGITNAFNLLDNRDGLTSGLAGIAALSFAVMGVVGSMPLITVAAASLAGASLGFLAHNRHPAKIFMGDAGSNFIGFMLALIGARLRFDNLVEVTFLVPVIVLGLPILDTTLVVSAASSTAVPCSWATATTSTPPGSTGPVGADCSGSALLDRSVSWLAWSRRVALGRACGLDALELRTCYGSSLGCSSFGCLYMKKSSRTCPTPRGGRA